QAIYLARSHNNSVSENKFTNDGTGIILYLSEWNEIFLNNLTDITNRAIDFSVSHNNTVAHNTLGGIAFAESKGISLDSSDNNTIYDNNCVGFDYGIFLLHDNDTLVIENVIIGGRYGIYAVDSNHNITGNILSAFTETGIEVHFKKYSIMTDNVLNSDGQIGIQLYFDNATITGNNITGVDYGIRMWGCDSNITNNIITAFNVGIWLENGNNNNISDNVCSGGYNIGIRISKEGQIISRNNCSHNNYAGILFDFGEAGPGSIVSENNCSHNGYAGIVIDDGNGQNNISLNNCSYNGFAGIHILTSSKNHVFENVLIRNVQWCILDEGTSNNIHDNFCLLPAPTILTSTQTIFTDSLLIDWTDVNGVWYYNVYVNDILNTTAIVSEVTVYFSYSDIHSVTVAPVHNVTEGDRSAAIFITVIVDTTAPTWDLLPSNQLVELGTPFTYGVTANDPESSIDHYWINDTRFTIDGVGDISNATVLAVGKYWLEVRAYNPYNLYCSAAFTVTVEDTTPPIWVTAPTNQVLEYGEALDIQLAAMDLSGIDQWVVNDTVHFSISGTGRLISITTLDAGQYGLTVTVYDPYGNHRTATCTITVQTPTTTTPTTTSPPGIPGFPIAAIVFGVISALALGLVLRRKKEISKPDMNLLSTT
ncbi:MAG: NosD domain-containing protein, partial [Promethearchaeota archaeon]